MPPRSRTSTTPQPIKVIESLFERLHAAYGMRFVDMWSNQDPKRVKQAWAEQLAGYSHDEMERGIARLPASWPPDAPQFAALCRPSAVADPEVLFHQAVELMRLRHAGINVVWPTVELFWAAARMGGDLQAHPYVALKRRWQAELDRARDDLDSGVLPPMIPAPALALAAPGQNITDRATAQKKLAQLKRLLHKD